METSKPYLKTREWIIVILYCGVLAAITLVTQICVPAQKPLSGGYHVLKSSEIEVSIEGAVKRPGIYILDRTSLVKNLLALAVVTNEADLSKVNLNSKLRQGRHLKIPKKERVTVRIEGEVEDPVTLTAEKGIKVKDLVAHVNFTERAESKVLLKKRIVKDGETITVPAKKSKNREKYCKKT